MEKIILEPLATTIVEESKERPYIFELSVAEARNKLEKIQSTNVVKQDVSIYNTYVNTVHGKIKIYVLCPKDIEPDKTIFYVHGAGWVLGSFHTHEKLVRELCARTHAVLIFPEYTRAPEAHFPVAIEECFAILSDYKKILDYFSISVKSNNLVVAGDSVGGNMAIALCFLSLYKNNPCISQLLLYYPVTDDNFENETYQEFGNGYYLYKEGMKWFWHHYAPDENMRQNILATPLKADISKLKSFPPTMILNGEADVLREEGELFASKLMEAKVDVAQITFKGMIHDFVMLNGLDQSEACRCTMDVSTAWINRK